MWKSAAMTLKLFFLETWQQFGYSVILLVFQVIKSLQEGHAQVILNSTVTSVLLYWAASVLLHEWDHIPLDYTTDTLTYEWNIKSTITPPQNMSSVSIVMQYGFH